MMAAIGCVMNKSLRIVYSRLKNKQTFDPDPDRRNKSKSLPKKKSVIICKVSRYKSYDTKAPISRRQNNNRKEEKKSQVLKLH